MAKVNFETNPRVTQIFEDLEKYLEFCRDYGYKFDESTLYDMRSYAYRQYQKFIGGKPVKSQWDEDIKV